MSSVLNLNEYDRIVDSEGRPTGNFLRYLLDRGGILGDGEEQLASLLARQIIAGVGLDGGGTLDADVTIDADVQAILDEIATTQGSILYRGASAWAALAPGTSGHFLKTNGVGANPAWAAASGGSGGRTQLATGTVSAATANLELALSGSYEKYEIQFYLEPSNDGANLLAQVTDDNFSTLKSGASDYAWDDTRGGVTTFDNSDSLIRVATNMGNAAGEFMQGKIEVIFPQNTSAYTQLIWRWGKFNSSGDIDSGYGTGFYLTKADVIDGIDLSPSAGTFDTGYWEVYGI